MLSDHTYSHYKTRKIAVDDIIVKMSNINIVTATVVVEDGRCMNISMTFDEAKALSDRLANPDVITTAEKVSTRNTTVVHTQNGTATVSYLGKGRFSVADGAATITRHSTGRYWSIEGKKKRFSTQRDAIEKVLEGL